MAVLAFSENDFLKACKRQKDFIKNKGFELGAEAFLREFYREAAENEFLDYSLEECVELARDFWQAGQIRPIGTTHIDLKPGLRAKAHGAEMLLQIITDDKPFLVDSVINAISAFGIDVLALFHPIVFGVRDAEGKWVRIGQNVAESMILVIIPAQMSDKGALLQAEIVSVLQDVDIITSDFGAMVETVKTTVETLRHNIAGISKTRVNEAITFLEWVAEGHFVLLGVRTYNFKMPDGQFNYGNPVIVTEKSLGVLRDTERLVLRQSSEPSNLARNVSTFVAGSDPVTVEKSNLFSTVHRRVRMDFISVKQYEDSGQVVSEIRFVGLFTSEAYSRDPAYIPLLRRKIKQVKRRANYDPVSHNGKVLSHVLSTYPRDELFQISEDELFSIATSIAQAYDRPRTRLFVRSDPFQRFVSILIYIPRENYNSEVRKKIGVYLKTAYKGRISAFYPQYSDSALARVHFIIGLDIGCKVDVDVRQLEDEIAVLVRPWLEQVKAWVIHATDTLDFNESVLSAYTQAFGPAYQSRFDAVEACRDIGACEKLSDAAPLRIIAYRKPDDEEPVLRAKIYQLDERLSLSRIMPILGHFGLFVDQEFGYEINRADRKIWIHDFEMHLEMPNTDTEVDFTKLVPVFTAFIATWRGINEDDEFNRLILHLTMPWRYIAFLRLLASYRRQSGLDPSQAVQVEALALYPHLTRHLIDLIQAKFDPQAYADMEFRKIAVGELETTLAQVLEAVKSLDHDNALRRIFDVIKAALRTNFYQPTAQGTPKNYIALKVDSRAVEHLPEPVPYREIYISSSYVDGVHIRFGSVARGGLRWSDRRDDFRTEVLGLVKAQQVKNAVIVPVGSKGGFYPKNIPAFAPAQQKRERAIQAYKIFISGMLDITDNYHMNGIVLPSECVCWDNPDPYLVVAADKGTAHFSDIANEVSAAYGFWLGDGFASGGSIGYDHKAMAITARGAWEAVKRHFREIDKDIQSEDFTVIGCGDMSGDVFGNGMLLSQHICLIGAFDHRDIFIDPKPQAAASYKERQRLFMLARSSWQDYDKSLISQGGGVFSRAAKRVDLSAEMQNMLGIQADWLTPDALIQALLKSRTELLWFGGIGTYIMASMQNHADVGDKSNDNVRVYATQVQAEIIGEGANLGLTQLGRMEFAAHGGRLNMDAIDNSAGVDMSDHEVNIKILLDAAIASGELVVEKRTLLLEEMGNAVADLVLAHNYEQTLILSITERRSQKDHAAYGRLMSTLEQAGMLDRAVENLPDPLKMQEELTQLTRPEIAVLIAYQKNALFEQLIHTNIADEPYMDALYRAYFPSPVQGFTTALEQHRLRREIIVSCLSNQLVNYVGPLFMLRLQEQTRAQPEQIIRAFLMACDILGIGELRADINQLDNHVKASVQYRLHQEIMRVLQRSVAWLIRQHDLNLPMQESIAVYRSWLEAINVHWLRRVSAFERVQVHKRIKNYKQESVPQELGQAVALLRVRSAYFEIIKLGTHVQMDIKHVENVFYRIGQYLQMDQIKTIVSTFETADNWERLAILQLEEDLSVAHATIAMQLMRWLELQASPYKNIQKHIQNWLTAHETVFAGWLQLRDGLLETTGGDAGAWSYAKLAIINSALRKAVARIPS